MKSFFAITALIGFTGVMLFGVFLMVHSGNASGHTSCLPTLMGSKCRTNTNPLEYVRVHLGAFTELMNIIPAFGAMAAFAVLVILLYAASIFRSYRPLIAPREHYSFPGESGWQVVQEKFFKWMALHEKRDPSFAFAAST